MQFPPLGMNPVLTNLIVKKFNKNLLISAYQLRFFASMICYIIFILIILIFNEAEIYLNYSLILGLIIILLKVVKFFLVILRQNFYPSL